MAEKVLIVDDDDIICTLLKDTLGLSYDVTTVQSPNECLQAMHSDEYRVILMDFQIPEMGGIELMRQIEQQGLRDNSKIILMSANEDVQSLTESAGEKADAYLQKPFSMQEIFSTIKNLETC